MSTIIVFDADCVLCSSMVHFVLKHERDQNIRFVSAWSEEGLGHGRRHGLSAEDLDRTFLVIEGEAALTQSDAALAIARHLHQPWRALGALRIVPRFLRDGVYRLVARNRYRWFGHKPNCFIPPLEQRHRFVSGTRADMNSASS